MVKSESHIPKIRFQGFSDAWDIKKLSQISSRVKEKNNNNQVTETFTNSAEKGIINQRDFFDKDISNEANLDNYYIVQPDDFVYNPRISNFAPVGPIKRNKLGRSGVMSPLYSVFRPDSNTVNFDYLEHYFSTTNWHKFMFTHGDQGARSDRFAIGMATFQKMPISLPELQEQDKIGGFFQKIDQVIELQQKALDTARDYKKSMLQKMFPQKGEKVPQIRFDGFSGNWKNLILAKIIKCEFKGKAQLANLTEGNNEYLDAERLNGGVPQLVNLGSDVDYHDILILWDGSKAGTIYSNFRGVLGSTLKCYKIIETYSATFVYQFLKSQESIIFRQYRTPNIPHVVKNFSDIFMVPSITYQEQQKIGEFFQKLDQQIEQYEKKLESYQNLKKAMLQRMFV